MRFILSLTTAIFVLSACSGLKTASKTAGGPHLTLLYQQGREGQFEPCGCHTYPFGGIDRELNAVNAIREKSNAVLFVDAGNLFGPPKEKAPVELFRKRADLFIKLMKEAKLDVFAPGPGDYRLGLPFLKEVASKASFKFVSTNVVDAKGKPVFAPYELFTVGGVKVAVLSVTGPQKLAGVKVLDPQATLKKTLKTLPADVQLTVLLSQMGDHVKDLALAAAVPEVQVLIGNDPERTIEGGDPRKGTLLLDGHRFGYYLGKAELDLKLPVVGFESEKLLETNRRMVRGYESALKSVQDPKRQAQIKARIADFKSYAPLESIPGASTFENTLMPLDEKNYGSPNAFTPLMAEEKKRQKRAAIEGAAKPRS